MGFVELRRAGFTWVVARGREEIVSSLQDWTHERLASDPACKILKRQPRRFAAFLSSFFLKSEIYRRKGLGCFRQSAGRKEWNHTLYARSKGLPVAEPIAFGERRRFFAPVQSLLLSERVDHGTAKKAIDGARAISPIVEAMGALLRRLHDAD